MSISPKQEGELFSRVLDILNRYDLSGLGPGDPDGVPIDEYEPEARSIESVLVNRGELAFADVREVWRKWFSDDLAGVPRDAATSLVREINSAREAILSDGG